MLTIHDLYVSYDDNTVLHGVNLNVARGEIFCLLGPSGCGKSTLLRTIAGLENPDEGAILVDGESVTHLPPNERGFGLMFQSFALFPHMNVANNVMFGLKMRGYSKPDRIQRMREVLELVELSEFEDRHISTLSGGQQQRVALARSIAPNPRLLMLDEPLGSLDVTLSRRLVVELRQIIKKVGLTAVYVTHNQQEAFSIGDRVAIMNEGHIEQIGSGQDIYRKPKTIFTAKFLGLTNILPIERFDDDMAHTLAGRFVVDRNAEALLIHPDGVQMVNANAPHMLSGEVSEVEFQGDVFKIQIQVAPDVNFLLSVPSRGVEVPRVGQEVALGFSGESVIPLYG